MGRFFTKVLNSWDMTMTREVSYTKRTLINREHSVNKNREGRVLMKVI